MIMTIVVAVSRTMRKYLMPASGSLSNLFSVLLWVTFSANCQALSFVQKSSNNNQPSPTQSPTPHQQVSRHFPLVSDDFVAASFQDSTWNSKDSHDHKKKNHFLSGSPYLALVTNRNACDSRAHFQRACTALRQALDTNQVDLVSVRLTKSTADPDLVLQLIQCVVNTQKCPVVVWEDWLEQAVLAQAHGIHMKEFQWDDAMNDILQAYQDAHLPRPLLGTTCHSLPSARQAVLLLEDENPLSQTPSTLRPQNRLDYLFVGSCYYSGDSHPEKPDVEGPALPGQVAAALDIPVFGIGGVDLSNCVEPLQQGAHGVVVIRGIWQSEDPAQRVVDLKTAMQSHLATTTTTTCHGSQPRPQQQAET